MTNFRILAQSYTTDQRIARTVVAVNAEAALHSVAGALDAAGFYALTVDAI